MCYLDGTYSDTNQEDIKIMQDYILSCSGPLVYSGTEEISEGLLSNTDITLMHNRSVSENVIYNNAGEPFNGSIEIVNGKLTTNDITVVGDSLLLGADLTGKAFTRSVFGEFGQYIVAICLLLFAF